MGCRRAGRRYPAGPMESQPVFVAEHAWRGRAVKAAIAAAALLLLAWLVAIVIGAFGFGSLPGVTFAGDDRGGGGVNRAHGAPGSTPQGTGAADAESAPGALPSSGAGSEGTLAGSGGSGTQDQAPEGGGGSANSGGAAVTPAQVPKTIPGSSKSVGNGRGAPPTKPIGGRGAPDVNPSGRVPGADAGGANPNAGGANADGNGNGGGNPVG